ncbi:isochorismatase family protein [Nocardioides sp. DS6]|uniref:isochorismatase n=1 Tax=Nocardioides eburneus TaxID=3231482 RepID=A0ABV3SW07_9ACTN
MALPTLIEYAAPVPPQRALPLSTAPWVLDPTRAAVLVHDLQRYFLRPYAPGCEALTGALQATARILTAARAAGVPVFYTAQDGDHADRGLQADLWGPGMSAVADHTGVVPEVAPAPEDTLLVKRRYSAFAKSDLAERLAGAGRDQLVITGVYAHIGITATAFDGFQREVQPFVVADAVADFGADQHARALDQIAACCGVVALADHVVAAFTPGRADGWDGQVRAALARLLPTELVERAFAEPEADLFELGLNSLQAFDMLDDLADAGVDIDFGEFTRRACVAYLVEQGERVGSPA